jgi:hypothetical protein
MSLGGYLESFGELCDVSSVRSVKWALLNDS